MKAITEPYRSDISDGEHLIGAFVGDAMGPTLIVVGSLHGNEPAGAIALEEITGHIHRSGTEVNGRIYFIAGNTRALAKEVRFIDHDLNRAWTPATMASVGTIDSLKSSEGRELSEIDQLLDGILITAHSEVYVLDLHSTSAGGEAFATIGDTLRNRQFAQKFPVTILLGIEEQLDGTMLEYLNNTGAVTLGFEGGRHQAVETVANHTALVWLALNNTGILVDSSIPDLEGHYARLASTHKRARVIEIRHREPITGDDEFEMDPGYNNFDPVTKDQKLAKNKHGMIVAPETGLILMPLYQKLGEDGFFIGREVARFWLGLSSILRRARIQYLIRLLPGVMQDPDHAETLLVNTNMARFFPLQIFHLLGYRKRRWKGNNLVVTRRRHDTNSPFIKTGK